jgi:hypothetical protein
MSDDQNSNPGMWAQPSPDGAAIIPPVPEEPSTTSSIPTKSASKSKISLKIVLAISAAVVLFVGLVLTLTGGSESASSGKTEWLAWEYRSESGFDVFLASVKDKDVVAGTRIADQEFSGFTYYATLKSTTPNYVPFVKEGDTIFTWGEDDDDRELSAISKKDGTTTSVYRGSDINEVLYIADEKIFLISDDGSCFTAKKDETSSRLGYGNCQIGNGKLITAKSEDSEVTVEEMNPDGSESNRNTFPLKSWSIRNNGRLITGVTEEGVFEAYSISTGKRIYAASAEESVTVLSESTESSNLLLAVENPELEDSTIDVGVMITGEGGASFVKMVSPSGGSGFLSPKGDEFLLVARETQESSDLTISKYKVSDKSSTVIKTAESIEGTWKDNFGRYAIVTDSEVISGDFKTGFQESATGSFEDSSLSFRSSQNSKGILVSVTRSEKTDVYFIKDGATDGRSKTFFSLVTGAPGINFDDSSLAIPGHVVYSEISNSYMEIFKQKLEKDSQSVKVAEGRFNGFDVLPSNEYYYYERDDNSVVMYHQKGDKPDKREQISSRYLYLPVTLSENPNSLDYGSSDLLNWAYAVVDEDLRACREAGAPILTYGSSQLFNFTRSTGSTVYSSEKQTFCVTTTGEPATAIVGDFSSKQGNSYVWVEMVCSDRDSDWSQSESYKNEFGKSLRTDIDIPSTPGTYTCLAFDDTYYSYYEESNMGADVTIEIRSSN